jgi:hypothetical protein
MNFKCERCGYVSEKTCNLKTHLSRKKPCRDIKKCGKTLNELLDELHSKLLYKCTCGMHFGSKQGLNQHKNNCVEAKISDNKIASLLKENSILTEEYEFILQTKSKLQILA